MTTGGSYRAAWEAWNDPAEPPGLPWSVMLRAHLENPRAVVVSVPGVFLVGRPVSRDWSLEAVVNPFMRGTGDERGAYHVAIAAGDLSRLWEWLPADAEWLAWQGAGYRLRWWPVARLRRLLG